MFECMSYISYVLHCLVELLAFNRSPRKAYLINFYIKQNKTIEHFEEYKYRKSKRETEEE